MVIFTILILPIHEQGRSFCLLRSSSEVFFDFFLQRLEVLVKQILHLFGESHTKLLQVFCEYFEGVISIISFTFYLSFEYKKVTDLFELILYPSTLLNLFISCRSSLMEFFGLLKHTIRSSVNSDTLTSSFPICMLFFLSNLYAFDLLLLSNCSS